MALIPTADFTLAPAMDEQDFLAAVAQGYEAVGSGVDLLCVGSRGYGAATRVLLGSVADELIVAAPVPLLIAARPGGEG